MDNVLDLDAFIKVYNINPSGKYIYDEAPDLFMETIYKFNNNTYYKANKLIVISILNLNSKTFIETVNSLKHDANAIIIAEPSKSINRNKAYDKISRYGFKKVQIINIGTKPKTFMLLENKIGINFINYIFYGIGK